MCCDEGVKPSVRTILGLSLALGACGPETAPVALYVAAIDFTSSAGANNRIDYEISGGEFDAPHVVVGDRVFVVEDPEPRVDVQDGRRLIADFDEPAPYVRRVPMRLRVTLGATAEAAARAIDYSVQGVLRSETEPSRAELPVLVASGSAEVGVPVELVTDDLPSRVDLYTLELIWTLRPAGCEECLAETLSTRHLVPTTWRQPIDEAPRYRRTLVWSAKFAAGEWPEGDRADESELALARAILDGFATLDEEGKSYGAFPRPQYDGTVDAVDVWIDFPRSACGELKHGLQAMIEYQGVDAQWGVLEFLSTGTDRYSQYETYEVVALGRQPQVWYQTNHAFVVVKGRVLDPTYHGYAETVADYEDQLFRRFCYGKEEPCRNASDWCNHPPEPERHCIDNPPGPDPDLGFVFYSGDNYR